MGLRVHNEDAPLDGEVHFIEPGDEYVESVLCFPYGSGCGALNARISLLKSSGFIYLLSTGSRFNNLRILGKGYSSIIVLASHRKFGLGALKLRRLDSRRSSLLEEGKLTELASSIGIAPRVYLYHDEFIFREYVREGQCAPFVALLSKYLESGDADNLRKLIREVLASLYRADRAGLDHRELNRPGDHIWVCPEQGAFRTVIIDWESARTSEKPINVSAVCSFLLFRYRWRDKLKRALGWDEGSVIEALRAYKRTYSPEDFGRVLSLLGV